MSSTVIFIPEDPAYSTPDESNFFFLDVKISFFKAKNCNKREAYRKNSLRYATVKWINSDGKVDKFCNLKTL